MKYKVRPTQHERVMREDDFIVSKTDLKGRITYCNRIFVEFAGYTRDELMGAQHNIVRHPDMPRGVFKFLWDTVEQGQECFAYVKNLCKNGDHYWVFANITPDRDAQGNTIGYFSVRRKASPAAIDQITPLYQAMLAEEARAGARDACEASLALLTRTLQEKGMSYEQFVLGF
ncbi:MAG: PAS domain-containing protein [Rhodoferax sp.]